MIATFIATRIATAASLATIALATPANADVAKFDTATGGYCVRQQAPGSLVVRRVCAPRDQWIEADATRRAPIARRLADRDPSIVVASTR